MENLPILCLKKVFDYLPNLNEQIRCSCTCKQWRDAFQVFKPTTLCLYADRGYLPINKRFVYTNGRFTSSNSFSVRFFDEFLASNVTRTYFSQVKKLAFYKRTDEGVCDVNGFLPKFEFTKQLNYFRELEYLEMETESTYFCCLKDRIIDLPKLEVLSLTLHPFKNQEMFRHHYLSDFEKSPIILNTPSLKVFNGGLLSDFTFLFPEHLKHLDTYIVCLPIRFEQNFVNLECLILTVLDLYSERKDPKIVSDELLGGLSSLKRLIIRVKPCHKPFPHSLTLAKQVADLNFDDLQVFLFSDDNALDFQSLRKCTKFFGQIDHLPVNLFPFLYRESDSLFDEIIKSEIPLHYFSDYLQLYDLEIGNNPIDQSHLLKLLKSVRYLDQLTIHVACPLGQSFFDRLPDCLTMQSLSFCHDSSVELPDRGLLVIRDFTFLTRLVCREIEFPVYRKPLAWWAICNLLKNENCLSISILFVGFHSSIYRLCHLEDYDCGDLRLLYEKTRANRSLFKDFYCPKCRLFAGEPFEEIKQHVKEHLVIENLDDKSYASRPAFGHTK